MRFIQMAGAALLPLAIALAGCSGSRVATQATNSGQVGHFIYIDDVSTSPATMNDPAVAQAVERRIGDDLTRNVQLGDTITLYEAGSRAADRMVAHAPIVTDYNLRIPTARAQLLAQMREITARYHAQGGDNATNLLLSLESIRPGCTPRSTVTLVTDGVEESDAYSVTRALAAGRPINLPNPPGKFLAGCRVRFLAFGLTDDESAGKEQLLPARSLAALRQGWVDYLEAAGVRPNDVEFVSIL